MVAGQDHLQGHKPAQTDLACFVDHAHAATAKLGQQLVIANVTHGPQQRIAAGCLGCERRHIARVEGPVEEAARLAVSRQQGFDLLFQLRIAGQACSRWACRCAAGISRMLAKISLAWGFQTAMIVSHLDSAVPGHTLCVIQGRLAPPNLKWANFLYPLGAGQGSRSSVVLTSDLVGVPHLQLS